MEFRFRSSNSCQNLIRALKPTDGHMTASLTALMTASDRAENGVPSLSGKDSTPRAAQRYRHYRLGAVMSFQPPTIVFMFLMTLAFCGCTKSDWSTHKASIELERQLSFPEIHMQARGVTADKKGNVVVAGSKMRQAFAVASDPDGRILWQYPRTQDGAAGTESAFAGAVQLDDGNYLLCGYKSGPNNATGCIAQPALGSTLGACISRCLLDRARRRGKVGTHPSTRRSLRLKAFASKRFGFPLFSPSINAERITSISAPRSCSRRIRSRMYSLSLVY